MRRKNDALLPPLSNSSRKIATYVHLAASKSASSTFGRLRYSEPP
jgi:hypothetical protein